MSAEISGTPGSLGPPGPQSASLTRFAPAPTGWLHLGHVLNALYVWNTARAAGCRVMLRIEDHDRERCQPEYERGILDDLDWLGFAPDVYPTRMFRAGRCDGRQSDRDAVYHEALGRLRDRGLIYACDCTRRSLAAAGTPDRAGDLKYPGTCRDRNLPLADGLGWRVRLPAGVEAFEDGLLGRQEQSPAEQCGDMLIRDRLGNWTYQFAVTVDDWRQSVDLVIRGVDLLPSTGRQIQLARLLGREVPPIYMHHPLVMKTPDQKLSKSDGATGIRDLRAAGWTREQVFAAAGDNREPVAGSRGDGG
jgi:glutamyl-tRNA synthetase/glutamyl-Q tRNA(Asp) synthetase